MIVLAVVLMVMAGLSAWCGLLFYNEWMEWDDDSRLWTSRGCHRKNTVSKGVHASVGQSTREKFLASVA